MKISRQKFPPWLRVKMELSASLGQVVGSLRQYRLNTVCQSARCPNRARCWSLGTATVMILGSVCTRNCRFCSVEHGKPAAPQEDEPERVAQAVEALGLKYVVVTSVTRDDLADGGASHFAAVISAIRKTCPEVHIEVLVPDFRGDEQAIARLVASGPDVYGHNLETVRRLHAAIRPEADYSRSLTVLRRAYELGNSTGMEVKSGFMVGLGETAGEVIETLQDLRAAGVSMVAIGQYLQPDRSCLPVKRFVPPEEFRYYERVARELGFRSVASGPLVRSSYCAEEYFNKRDLNG